MMEPRDVWKERPVVFLEMTMKEGRTWEEAIKADPHDGAYFLLVLSMHWADSRERVFPSTEQVWSEGYSQRQALERCIGKAMYVNGLQASAPQDGVVVPLRAEEAQALPSL